MAYAYVIPLSLYLLTRFYRKPGYGISLLFGIFIFIITGKHLYFIVLVGVPWAVFWFLLLLRYRRFNMKIAFLIPHVLIQMILPFILFSLFAGGYDQASDRTAYPWGFFSASTRWVSVFLPLLKPYARWIIVGPMKTVGYVGMVSTILFAVTLVLFGIKWAKGGFLAACWITDRFILNVFLAGAALCLFLALGYPFTYIPELLNYTGPFRQLRVIGRFVVPFYYIMNIYSLYILWRWYTTMGKRWFWYVVLIALAFMGLEAYFTVKDKPGAYFNKFETLNDRQNTLPDNAWVNNHEWPDYQAIMPMPYYHIGSETYWVNGTSPVIERSYIASLKTGLPLNSVMLSRTSISQTLANLDIFWEPGSGYPVLKDYDPEDPLLIMRDKKGILNENESMIIEKSTLIDSNGHTLFYRFYLDSLEAIRQEHLDSMVKRAKHSMLDTAQAWHYFESYNSLENGQFTGKIKEYSEFASCGIPDSGRFEVSFWYHGAGKDLWPRTYLIISLLDSNLTAYNIRRTDFFRETVMRDGDWALVSLSVEVRSSGDHLKLHYDNPLLTGGEMLIDRVLVREKSQDLFIQEDSLVLLNNRQLPVSVDWDH
jgi:MFS family permease